MKTLLYCLFAQLIGLSLYAQSDSACYSLEENAAITRGLIELDTLRRQHPRYALAIGHYQVRQAGAIQAIDKLIEKGCFLCGYRKRLRRLKQQLTL